MNAAHTIKNLTLIVCSRPGLIDINLHTNAGISDEARTQKYEWAKGAYFLRRPGKVEEIAEAIAFLASSQSASFITGETLAVDGGILCT